MVVSGQVDEMFENNRHVMEWAGLTDENDDLLDLTGRVVKFALTRFLSDGVSPNKASPILDFASDDVSPQVTIPNPTASSAPHVRVVLEASDTVGVIGTTATPFYFELEVFESDESDPVVVATGSLTVKPNVTNS